MHCLTATALMLVPSESCWVTKLPLPPTQLSSQDTALRGPRPAVSFFVLNPHPITLGVQEPALHHYPPLCAISPPPCYGPSSLGGPFHGDCEFTCVCAFILCTRISVGVNASLRVSLYMWYLPKNVHIFKCMHLHTYACAHVYCLHVCACDSGWKGAVHACESL